MMNIISKKPLILDYSWQSEEGFMHLHLATNLRDPNDVSKGVDGLCRAGAFGRLAHILATHGAAEPKIISVISDTEVELTYVVKYSTSQLHILGRILELFSRRFR